MGANLAVDHKGGGLISASSPAYIFRHSLNTGETVSLTSGWGFALSNIAIDDQQRYLFMDDGGMFIWRGKLNDTYPYLVDFTALTYGNGIWCCNLTGIAIAPTLTPSSVTETPNQPVYGAPPPVVTVPPEKSKNLVLLVHGWNSDPSAWATPMKESIKNQLPSYNGQEGCNEGQTIEDANNSWQICT